jgi:hypothetical protein
VSACCLRQDGRAEARPYNGKPRQEIKLVKRLLSAADTKAFCKNLWPSGDLRCVYATIASVEQVFLFVDWNLSIMWCEDSNGDCCAGFGNTMQVKAPLSNAAAL